MVGDDVKRGEPLRDDRARGLGGAAGGDAADAAPGGPRQAPRHQRADRPRRGRGHLPAALPPAQPAGQRVPGPGSCVVHVPRGDVAARALRDRRGRQRRRRQEHVRPHPPGPAVTLARPSARRPRDHGWLPPPQRRPRSPRPDGPQGVPGELRHAAPAGVPARRQERGRRGARPGVQPRRLRRARGRGDDRPPAGHPHPRRAQRPAGEQLGHRVRQRLLRLLDLHRRRGGRHPQLVHRPLHGPP